MQKMRSRIRPSFTAAPGRWWKNIAIPTLPVLACFLGGATEKWSEGIIVALLGLILLADPPRLSLGRGLNLILLAAAALAATAFLPASWFMQPAWRLVLENDFGLGLPGTLSPQPWISLGCFISFLAGLSWLYYVSALDLDLREVRQQLRLFATGIILLATVSIALHSAHTALPFWHNQLGFGPFPNRNQTANLFGLTALIVLACGQDDVRHGRKRWIAWLAGLALVVAAVVLDFSRAGILILVAGSALWLGTFVLRRGSAARIALGLSALLILLTAVLIFGGQTLERFHLRAGQAGDMAPDLRWAIFRDALALIRASPWCGIGLGNFDAVFAVFRDASLSGARTIHPESDWFWFWVEMGWPAVLLAIVGIALLVRRVFPLQEGTNQRFRLAALIAAILFVLHGLVDVSGHRVGTVYAGMFLFGMALRRPAQLLRLSSWAPVQFRLLGLALSAAGISWIVATRYEMPLPGAIGAENETRKAAAASQGRNFGEAIERTTRALGWAPLTWQLYFSRALEKIGLKRPPADALDDFRRARFLEPNAYQVPFQEGMAWLPTHPALALTAWQEALRRAEPSRAKVYESMLAMARERSPQVHESLEEIGLRHHDLALVVFAQAGGAQFMSALRRFLEDDPDLQSFSGEEKIKFFSLWAERGDLDELPRAIETHPDWMNYAWRAMAKYYARRNDFRGAFEIARRFGETPPLPEAAGSSIEHLQQAFHAAPDNYGAGYQLYRQQMSEGKIDEALQTVRHFTDLASCPRYFHFLEAEAWAAKENWERAWKAWEKFQAAIKK